MPWENWTASHESRRSKILPGWQISWGAPFPQHCEVVPEEIVNVQKQLFWRIKAGFSWLIFIPKRWINYLLGGWYIGQNLCLPRGGNQRSGRGRGCQLELSSWGDSLIFYGQDEVSQEGGWLCVFNSIEVRTEGEAERKEKTFGNA